MRKTIFILSALLAGSVLFSCGNSTQKVENNQDSVSQDSVSADTSVSQKEDATNGQLTITPKTTRIQGELGFCYDVVDEKYELSENDGNKALLTVKISRNNNSMPFNTALADTYTSSEEGGYIAVGFGIQIEDKDGLVVDETLAYGNGKDASEYAQDALDVISLSSGKTGTLRFVIHDVSKITEGCQFTITAASEER